jgi:hypothetical protein
MKQAIFGLAAAALFVATGPAVAAEFPPKPETIKRIVLGTVGDVFVPRRDPRASSMTFATTRSAPGFATSTSETFDNTPERPEQILRIINNSIYDLKDIAVSCQYVAESGTPVESMRSHTFLLVFPASSRRDVVLSEIAPLPYARGLACAVTDFDYVGIGHSPPPPDSGGRTDEPSIAKGTARPVVNEWAIGRRVY